MSLQISAEKQYYEEMLNSMGGLEDDLVANMAPLDALQHMREVVRLCREDYHKRFSEGFTRNQS